MGTPLVIAGMHRSGTSLLANLLQAAGVHIGDDLLPASDFNAKGHFEDLEFKHLHDDILGSNRAMFVPRRGGHRITEVHRRRARELIDRRAHLPLWGWKDPRTTLFLDFWAALLPEARWVFIFREPGPVLDSLRKRKADRSLFRYWRGFWVCHRLFGLNRFRIRRAIDAWIWHNRLILDFMDRHPERCLLLDLDRLEDHFPKTVAHLHARWGLPMRPVDLGAILDRQLQASSVAEDIATPCRRHRRLQATLAELRRRTSF